MNYSPQEENQQAWEHYMPPTRRNIQKINLEQH